MKALKLIINILVTIVMCLLWIVSLPVTVLAIIWQMAMESADKVFKWYQNI